MTPLGSVLLYGRPTTLKVNRSNKRRSDTVPRGPGLAPAPGGRLLAKGQIGVVPPLCRPEQDAGYKTASEKGI